MEQVLQTLVLIKTTVETLKNNQDRMRKLYTRCENLTARVIKKHGKYPNRAVTGPLQECLSNVSQLAQRFSKKNGFWHFVMVIRVRNAINRAYGDLDEALRDETLIILVDVEMRLAGVDGNVEELRKTLARMEKRQAAQRDWKKRAVKPLAVGLGVVMLVWYFKGTSNVRQRKRVFDNAFLERLVGKMAWKSILSERLIEKLGWNDITPEHLLE